MRWFDKALAFALAFGVAACGERAKLPEKAGWGPHPVLTMPNQTLLPTIDVARAVGWKPGETPEAAPGLKVAAFARGLDHPRWIYVLPNGDVLVAETNAPAKPDDWKGVTGYVARRLMTVGGSETGHSANRITLLRDTDGDGVADTRSVFASGLHSPFGMALVGDSFYVADTDAVLRFRYHQGDARLSGAGEKIADLPAGTRNHHWTKNLIASRDGSRLYVTVGSNSNAAENGMAAEQGRASIWEIDPATGAHRIFASGLRNPNGLGWRGNTLWVAVNERDELGSDLVPDYMTSVRDGEFYGWPYSYFGRHVDARVAPQRPDLVARAIAPDYALGAHTASLGLAFSDGAKLGPDYASGVFIGQHGSWNRDPPAGYQVVFVPFAGGKPEGEPRQVLGGFLTADHAARGRPVGVAIDKRGALLVADDVGNTIWRVTRD
ncbi:MAG: sorbosone dehydrogenase family protein [Alphaproteobacteria bacterium]|nr:sorbosone dehydrogenase family protein [Alphaproteobacteria bacterium]MBV9693498.1 sorbosone dehydrogenase family protein [Alphaproteobacteria bacterium]